MDTDEEKVLDVVGKQAWKDHLILGDMWPVMTDLGRVRKRLAAERPDLSHRRVTTILLKLHLAGRIRLCGYDPKELNCPIPDAEELAYGIRAGRVLLVFVTWHDAQLRVIERAERAQARRCG
jgi:hypothetical protein